MDRREFSALLPALAGLLSLSAGAQQIKEDDTHLPHAEPTEWHGLPKGNPLPDLKSGVYVAAPLHGNSPGRKAHQFLAGNLKAGNIQIEMHETWQAPGTPHEAIGTHLHNEIWLVREGTCELMTNGVVRTMRAGDVGLCCAGDTHWVRNAGDTPCQYFVITVGPPEQA